MIKILNRLRPRLWASTPITKLFPTSECDWDQLLRVRCRWHKPMKLRERMLNFRRTAACCDVEACLLCPGLAEIWALRPAHLIALNQFWHDVTSTRYNCTYRFHRTNINHQCRNETPLVHHLHSNRWSFSRTFCSLRLWHQRPFWLVYPSL